MNFPDKSECQVYTKVLLTLHPKKHFIWEGTHTAVLVAIELNKMTIYINNTHFNHSSESLHAA
jgi:hypothetical protein